MKSYSLLVFPEQNPSCLPELAPLVLYPYPTISCTEPLGHWVSSCFDSSQHVSPIPWCWWVGATRQPWFQLSGWREEVKKCPQRRYSAISPSHTEAEVTSSFLIPRLSPLPYVEGWRKQALGDFSPGRLSLAVWETWDLQRAFSDLQIWRRTLQTQQRSPSLLLWVPWWEAEATSCIPAMHLPTAPRLLFPQHCRESWNSSSPPQLFLFYFFSGCQWRQTPLIIPDLRGKRESTRERVQWI